MPTRLHRLFSKRSWSISAQAIAAALVSAVFVMGLWLGWTGYRHGLPFIDDPDEMTLWTMGRAKFEQSWPMFQPHYPPGMVYVSSVVQRLQIIAGNPFYDVAGTTAIMRMLSGINYSLTLLMIMWLAYRFVGLQNGVWGAWAAAFAGCSWFFVPLVLIRTKFAVTDPWLWLWMTATVVTGVEGWHRRSIRWVVASLLLAMVTAAFKWQGAAVLAIPGLACLRFWPMDRRRTVFYMVLYGIVVSVFAYWAVFIHGALEGDAYLPGVYTIRPTIGIVIRNILYQFTESGSPIVFGLLPILALMLPLFNRENRQQFYGAFPIWMFPLVLVCYDIILSFNGAPVSDRQYLAAVALQAVMAGVGFVLLTRTALQIAKHYFPNAPEQSRRLGTLGITGIGLAIGLFGPWSTAWQTGYSDNQNDLLPDRRAILAQWAATTATDGPLIVTETNQASALQTLYGYRGPQLEMPYNFDTSVVPRDVDVTRQMIDAAHIRYLITQSEYHPTNLIGPVTRLITYGNDEPTYRGDTWAAFYVGQLPPLFSPTEVVSFDQRIVLRGLTVAAPIVCQGTIVNLRMLWSAIKPPPLNYSFYLHLFNPTTGEKDASPSSSNLAGVNRPTTSWMKADELLIGDPVSMKIPADLPPGAYQLWLGVFEPLSGDRLRTPGGQDHSVVGSVNVWNCPTNLFF